ncbi:MAG: amidohydrolase/deacetylase family metallohydrolase [Acidobacteria bacterium]|nr:MAG: amidohydrolase/deacetylase family metallohydrolase [Acidobacteriota bacterium]
MRKPSGANSLGKLKTRRYDLLLKGGHVIDPANCLNGKMDVAVTRGKIAAIAPDIMPTLAGKVVDVRGLYVTPGLVDIHVHIGYGGVPDNWYSPSARSHTPPFGVPADFMLTSGVTTVVDTGSAGAETFLREKEMVMDHARVRVLAFLNIVANGMNGGLEQTVDQRDPELCAEMIEKHRDVIVGVKTAHYWTVKPWDAGHPPWAAVDRALECGRLAKVPMMVDFWPRPPKRSYADLILRKMRPGDIHTHVFAQQFPIVLPNGRVNPIMWKARKRGVIFDVGHGAGSFWFRNAVPAVEQGFLPDSISTDLHSRSMVGAAQSMTNVMSKFLAMGMQLEDVIRRSTLNPALEINRPDLGTLSVGREADIAVLEKLDGDYSFADNGNARINGNVKLVARMTVRAGNILFDPSGLSMVEWRKARKQYFRTPKLGSSRPSTADNYPRV